MDTTSQSYGRIQPPLRKDGQGLKHIESLWCERSKEKCLPGHEVIKLLYSTLLGIFILLINAKLPTIVCILTFISRINDWLWWFRPWKLHLYWLFWYLSYLNFVLNLFEHLKKFYNLGARPQILMSTETSCLKAHVIKTPSNRFVLFFAQHPRKQFSVMSGQSHRFLGITSTFEE